MKKTLMLVIALMFPVASLAGDFSFNLLAGQAWPEGDSRTDTLYGVGLKYAASDHVTVGGRLSRAEVDGDIYSWNGQVSIEFHAHLGKALQPYILIGAGAVEVTRPDKETEVLAASSLAEWEPHKTATVLTGNGSSYMEYHGGVGLDWKLSDHFGLTVDGRYVRPFDQNGAEDTIQVLGGIILDFGK
jgi:opacity protein-like surface antigen